MAVTDVHPDSAFHRMASDPAANVFVTASAGTGKTRSLVDRVTRLLLAGAAPASIVAITFTRTAAAEMQGRVLETLARWAGLDDAELDRALLELGETPSPEFRARARALLSKVLDAPQGLQIQTIHAAAQSLLAAFPIEAGLPPRADPLDERRAAQLREQALALALADPVLAADFTRIAVEASEAELAKQLPALARSSAGYAQIGRPQAVEGWLRCLVGLPVGLSPQAILEAAVTPPQFDDGAVAAFRDVIAVAGRKDAARANACIEAWPGWSPAQRVDHLAELLNLVLDSNGDRRGTANIARRLPGGEALFDRLFAAIGQVRETLRALAFVDHAGAWLRVGMATAGHYAHLKRAAAAVDFDDMVALAADLIHQDGMAGIVAERLDRRIAHVLVDEAQDTNRAQWRLIDGMTGDFDSGEGAHGDAVRTRFVVGDFKQAIFRFQGTDPRVFLEARESWGRRAAAGGNPVRDVPLDLNFRSAPILLRLVDAVLAELGPEAIGLPPGTRLPPHCARQADLPGRILLLPPHEAAEAQGPDEPDEDEDPTSPADPAFADSIARAIKALVGVGSPDRLVVTPRAGPPRLAEPGDVLILVQARGDLMPGLVRALHAEGLPVAGVDRTRLSAPLAVRDLLALIRFVLQPHDDLALAEVLTSPLGGLDHEAIRKARVAGESLWQSINRQEALAGPVGFLRDCLARADFQGPHDFLQAVLVSGGRARFRARLGPEADDGLDLLLAEALAFEAEKPATLQGFLAHVAANDGELARDPDASPGLIRIMTVHGAKGLEAPIVVLADALRQNKPQTRAVLWQSADGLASVPLIFGTKERKPRAIAALAEASEQEEREEHNRLLYVAITRARQLLLVAGQLSPGLAKMRAKPGFEPARFNTWHDRIRRAMDAAGASCCCHPVFGAHLRLDSGAWPPPSDTTSPARPAPLPPWATTAAAAETAARPFSPSAPLEDESPNPPPGPAQRAAAERGILLHRLFEHLPGLLPAARPAAGRRLLEAGGATDPEPLLAEALAILEDPALAHLFGPESLAEAPIAGRIGGVTVAGTVDRLVVTAGRVAVIDFKTGLAVPADLEAIYPQHLRQMAAYRAVLAAAFPGHAVEAFLLYTAGPRLHLLPETLLARHWPPGKADSKA